MKIYAFLLALLAPAILYTGYYKTQWAEDNRTVFFLKKEPTLQVAFTNMFSRDSDLQNVHTLSSQERREAIEFCRYFSGLHTELKSQSELEACSNAYGDAR
ncbi:hypothetical protein [Pseudomonas sp. NPDC090201]|uniref:hypothetical protein n=1 Tax=Pseudomonas sp. NPDC090201 TaxID=3364475 RepID=UPI00381BEBBB